MLIADLVEMKHYAEISHTDASAVVQVRKDEIRSALNTLNEKLARLTMEPMPGQRKFDWGDVGTLSSVLKQLEELNDSLR